MAARKALDDVDMDLLRRFANRLLMVGGSHGVMAYHHSGLDPESSSFAPAIGHWMPGRAPA